MATLSEHQYRLGLFKCCLADKANTMALRLKFGNSSCCDINKFETLIAYYKTLKCFDPGNITCLTQVQIDKIWDDISIKCDICFPPYGQIITTTAIRYILDESSGIIDDESGNGLIEQ
jgi:hypothetical protein